MDQDVIDQVSEKLADVVRDTTKELGTAVTIALLIHYLHEVSLEQESNAA